MEENVEQLLFRKIDELREEVREAKDVLKWQGSFLQSEFGHKIRAGDPYIEGNTTKANRKRFEAIETTLQGKDNKFGLATRVDIMWKAHFPVWAAITSAITAFIIMKFKSMVGK